MNIPPRPAPKNSETGSTLVESMVSAAIASTAIAGLCVANATCLGIARAHKEFLVADQCLQQRVEQFRAANWSQVTDTGNASSVLAQPSANDGTLQGQTETVTINAYPAVTPSVTPIVISRDGTGVTGVLSQPPAGFSLRNAAAVRIDIQESWVSAQAGRTRQCAVSTVVAFGGLRR